MEDATPIHDTPIHDAGQRPLFLGYLEKAGLTYTKPQGAHYVMVDISELDGDDDTAFCEWLVRDVGVSAVPGSSFFRQPVRHLIHFHFAKQNRTLISAGERLLQLREKARQRQYPH